MNDTYRSSLKHSKYPKAAYTTPGYVFLDHYFQDGRSKSLCGRIPVTSAVGYWSPEESENSGLCPACEAKAAKL